MEKSPTIAALATALAKAQGEIGKAKKRALNPAFKSAANKDGSKYSDLNELVDIAHETLPKFGLAVSQFPTECVDGRVGVTTILMHESGEWMQGTGTVPIEKSNAQGVGSAITYLRRYALKGVLGIADEDDDGNKASEKKAETPPTPPAKPSKPTPQQYYDANIGKVSEAVQATLAKTAKDSGINQAANDLYLLIQAQTAA